ncbi:MAG: zf-HC2 domain-containing protein [Acidobacteria bacterium]|nr:zf-HC2 domain-containing protein [Acidobacteriota bacterium]
MSEHLTQTQIEDYGCHTLSAAEFLSASRHLRVCEACRLEVERVLDADEVFYALKSEVFGGSAETLTSSAEQAHLSFERTAAYVDEALAGEELQVVKDHLTGCEQCSMAVEDLRAFRDQVTPGLNREYPPHLALPASFANENRWRRFVAAMTSLLPRSPSPVVGSGFFARSPALVVGSALAALLLIAAGWLIWQAVERNGKDPKMAQSSPSPTTPVVTPVVSPLPTQAGAATVIAQLNDGDGQVILDGNGKLSGVDHLPPAYQQMIRNALSSKRLEKPSLLAGLGRPDSLSMRGGDKQGNKFSVINPVGIVILSDRPTFRWSPLEGATGYIVEVYDDKLRKILVSSQGADTSWRATQSLKRGGIYSWQVTAIKGVEEFSSPRPPAPVAKFRILDEALANELVQARRAYASSHLMMALVYTQAGLLDEAEQEFRALQQANPNSAISRRLLASLQSMRH